MLGGKPMKKFISEFKAFISRGNVIDLAVGVIIGGAFAKIIASLVKDIFMPLIALITGRNLNDLVWVLKAVENPNPLSTEGTAVADAVTGDITYYTTYITMNWGVFLQTIIDFLLVALLIFVIIKALAAASKAGADLKKKVEEKLPVKEEKK